MDPMTSRLLALATLLLTAPAVAAPPQKGIGSPKDEDCSPAPAPPPSSSDRALLRGLSWAFEPAPLEVRVLAIEDLGFLGDPRALNPLAQLCLDPNPQVARAALRAIGAMRHPRAEEILANVVRHPLVSEVARQRALELLPFQNTWSSLRTIGQLARTSHVSSLVLAARRLASELPPAPSPAPPEPPPPATPASPSPHAAPGGPP
jgi:HEAT repeats